MKKSYVLLIVMVLYAPLALALNDSLVIWIMVPPGSGKTGEASRNVDLTSSLTTGESPLPVALSSKLYTNWIIRTPTLASGWANLKATASGEHQTLQTIIEIVSISASTVDGGLSWILPQTDDPRGYFDLNSYSGPTIMSIGGKVATTGTAHAYGYNYPLEGLPEDYSVAYASLGLTQPVVTEKKYTVNIDSLIQSPPGYAIYGTITLSGEPSQLNVNLVFEGSTTSKSISLQLKEGTRYILRAPSETTLLVRKTLTKYCSWDETNSSSTIRTCSSGEYYTGSFDITLSFSFTSRIYSLRINAVSVTGLRKTLYTGFLIPGNGTIVLRNITLEAETIDVSAQLDSNTKGFLKLTLEGQSQDKVFFDYWLIGSTKIQTNSLTGTINSNIYVRAVYSLSQKAPVTYLLPGMDFQPANGTHFIPIKPGVYTFSTNASLILLDTTRSKIITLQGASGSLIVSEQYGECARAGTKTVKDRTPSIKLPLFQNGSSKFYLFSIMAPEKPNMAVYLKLNDSVYYFRTIVPVISIKEIKYSLNKAEIIFTSFPPWENYNVTASYNDLILTTVPASNGRLTINYSLLQNVTRISRIKIYASWGRNLLIPNTTLELILVPVSTPVTFTKVNGDTKLLWGEPVVLGEKRTLREKLFTLNETWIPGRLYVRLISRESGVVLWENEQRYLEPIIIPLYDGNRHSLEVLYVPGMTREVLVIPWLEKL
ncbi:MAG: hypothetical protein ACPLRJ_03960 [Infirmifilum uzonense]|uniref:hypothetical protein n=1 Tax=Infirmifilum uzonense TaxID=1550241 RepID=UPI003C7466EF